MANMEFSHLHNVCAFLERSPKNAQFHDVITFLERSSISFAIQERPPVFDQLVRSFWDSAKLHDEDNVQGIAATVSGHQIVITQAMIRDALHLNDADGVISYSESRIHHCFQSIGYDAAPTRKQYKKSLLSSQWRYIAHVILKCMTSKKRKFDELSQQQAAAMAGLIYGQNFSFSNMIFQNLRTNVQAVGNPKFLLYPRFLQIIFNANIHGLPHEGVTLAIAHMDFKVLSFMENKAGQRIVKLFPHMLEDVEEIDMPESSHSDSESSSEEHIDSDGDEHQSKEWHLRAGPGTIGQPIEIYSERAIRKIRARNEEVIEEEDDEESTTQEKSIILVTSDDEESNVTEDLKKEILKLKMIIEKRKENEARKRVEDEDELKNLRKRVEDEQELRRIVEAENEQLVKRVEYAKEARKKAEDEIEKLRAENMLMEGCISDLGRLFERKNDSVDF